MSPTRAVAAVLAFAIVAVTFALAPGSSAQPGTSGNGRIVLPEPGQLPTTPPPELSRECRAPGFETLGSVPLPNVANALRTRKVVRILAIGASSRGGVDGGYYEVIERLLERTMPGLDVQIVHRGYSGELAADAAQRLITEVALVEPQLVLWQLGTHDALQQVSVDEFKTTVSTTVDWLQSHNVDVVLVGLHYIRGLTKDPHYQAIRQALRTIVDAKWIMRIGRYEAMQVIDVARQKTVGGVPSDPFALTDQGYSCLSEYVARAVTAGIFARSKRPQRPGLGSKPPRG